MPPFFKFLNRAFKPQAGQLYGAAVAQARQPAFYAGIGADDTADGRFAMISLHILLLLERLSSPAGPLAQADPDHSPEGSGVETSENPDLDADLDPNLGRELMEVFVEDLDQSMRELGIGDMGVPKRAKKAMAQFYDYARRYRALRHSTSDGADANALAALLSEMVPGLTSDSAGLTPLVDYVRAVEKMLSHETATTIAAGAVPFPDIDMMINGDTCAPMGGAVS